jgi:hypothetical protein
MESLVTKDRHVEGKKDEAGKYRVVHSSVA